MKKDLQTTTSTDPQEKRKTRVPFFAQHLKKETLRTISGGGDDDDLEGKVRAAEKTTKGL